MSYKKLKAVLKVWAGASVVLALAWVLEPVMQKVLNERALRPSGISQAHAIPAFARKYGTSCTTCHSPVPIKLNNFGKAFKDSGYRMPGGDEASQKLPDQELGAEAWKEMWPKSAVWPGKIPSNVPVAFQIYLDARYDPHTESAGTQNTVRTRFHVPHEFEIMTAGTLGEHVSWAANAEFLNENTIEITQAYGQFDNLFDSSLLNFRFGRLEPRFVPFTRFTQRFIATDFLTSEFQPSIGTASGHRFSTMQAGTEIWGVKSVQLTGGGFQYALGLVNGGGPKASDETNSAKDYYGRLAYKFGGMGVGRSITESSALKQAENWIDNSIRVGVSGYSGKRAVQEYPFSRLGFDLDLWFHTVNAYGIYMRGSDEGLFTNGSTGTVNSNSFTIGIDWVALPWLTTVFRYEGSEHENLAANGYRRSVRRFVPAVVVAIRPNVTWTTEFVGHVNVDGRTSGDDLLRTRFRFIF